MPFHPRRRGQLRTEAWRPPAHEQPVLQPRQGDTLGRRGTEPGQGEVVGDRFGADPAESTWQQAAGIAVGGELRPDQVDFAQRR